MLFFSYISTDNRDKQRKRKKNLVWYIYEISWCMHLILSKLGRSTNVAALPLVSMVIAGASIPVRLYSSSNETGAMKSHRKLLMPQSVSDVLLLTNSFTHSLIHVLLYCLLTIGGFSIFSGTFNRAAPTKASTAHVQEIVCCIVPKFLLHCYILL